VLLGLDHFAIAVREPDAAIDALATALGLPPGTSGGRHLAWGTRNRLLWLGDTFIELYTVDDAALAEASWLGRPALRALPGGPAATCWALWTDDLDRDRAEMNSRGAELAAPSLGERRLPDGRIARWRLALPPEVDLERPFLIDHDMAAAEWTQADRSRRAASPGRVVAIELPVDEIAGLTAERGVVRIGAQAVRLAGRDAGQPTIRIGGTAGAGATSLLGCRWIVE